MNTLHLIITPQYGRFDPFIVSIKPKKVIFHNPATIVYWSDGSKTVVKCQEGDTYDPEKGLALCCSKKLFGNKSNFNNIFKKYLEKEDN